MSGQYRVTPTAQEHLETIADYTLEEWGERQMSTYLKAIYHRFDWLTEHPKLGRNRPEIAPSLRSYREGSHLIFYRHKEPDVEIIAILHQSMDLKSYFDA